MLEFILICVLAFLAWRVRRLELKVEAMEDAYNELANLFDEMTNRE